MNSKNAAILGALVADSATLGLHWIYDSKRIAEIETSEGLVFLEPDAGNYTGIKGYFAHGRKVAGESSSYGEVCLLMLQHLVEHGNFNRTEYQAEYRAHFGPGGAYVGYIDSPTRQTLHVLLPLEPKAFPALSGADDDQFLSLAALPSLVVTHADTIEVLMKRVDEMVRVTNNNDLAVAAAQCSAAALFKILHDVPIKKALVDAIQFAGDKLGPLLEEALSIQALDSIAVAKRFGLACHVAEGLPVVFHIAKCTSDYQTAIKANIRAGGDNCGRSIMLGAFVAAHMAKKDGATFPIPLEWLARYKKFSDAADACVKL